MSREELESKIDKLQRELDALMSDAAVVEFEIQETEDALAELGDE